MDKPHILLLIDDEHRPDVLGIEGNEVVRTPTLDGCIQSGAYFRSAYTPAPICVPARQSFLTGLYPRHNGCTGFDTPLPNDVLTLPAHLGHYGYYSCCAGKMHFLGQNQMHGWNERIGRDIAAGIDDSPLAHLANEVEASRVARPAEPDPGTGKWSTAKEIRNARAGKGLHLAQDLYTTEGALLFLEEYFAGAQYDRPGNAPLLMALSLSSPHYPYQCSEELFAYYLRRVEPYVESLPDKFDCSDFFKNEVGKDVELRDARRATAAYYGMVETVDRQYARVLDRLQELGVRDEFVVVFLSDHGEMLGQKGLWEKQQYFEASVRVPFSVSGPSGGAPVRSTVTENVSLVDLFPTICELVDVPIPGGLDGVSLVPFMDPSAEEGHTGEEPRAVYSELYHVLNGPSEMIREGALKYFRFNGRDWPDQLFDLETDPDERHNLIDDPTHSVQLAGLRAKLDAF